MIIREIVFILTLLISYVNASAQWTETNEDPEYYISVLERKTELQMDSIHNLEFNVKRSKRVMLKEHVRKKMWIKFAVGEAVLLGGVVLVITSGAWVPVIMGVAAIELFLVLEGRYRLNIHDFKIKKLVRYKM